MGVAPDPDSTIRSYLDAAEGRHRRGNPLTLRWPVRRVPYTSRLLHSRGA
jgi:hypothetical protein